MFIIIQRTLFIYMNWTGDNNHSKGATIKIVIASFQPLNSLMNFTLIAVTSTSNFNNFIGSVGKENLCKLPSLSLNVHSTEEFIDISGNDNSFL